MKHISDLKNLGQGKDCIIIGNGKSSSREKYDLSTLPKNIFKIKINKNDTIKADMYIWYDKEIKEYFESINFEAEYMVGYKHKTLNHTTDKTTHYYNHNDITNKNLWFGDSGFFALKFADNIFNFENIYLLGYDYDIDYSSIDFGKNLSNVRSKVKFCQHSIRTVQLYYYNDWENNIYNMNENSALKKFGYKKLQGELNE